ncbi:MAG: DMT family transporter [Pseudomonadota bacterium]
MTTETQDPADAAPRPLLATLWMTGAIVSFTSMGVAGRELGGILDTFEIMFFRSVIGFFIVIAVAAALGRLGRIRARKMHLHTMRNTCHFLGQNLWFYAVTVIPLAQVVALEFTTPLWVTLLAPFVLGERLTRTRALAAFFGFVGILIVARPDFTEIDPGVLAAAASAIGFAGSIMLTKILTRTETIVSILFWLTVIQAFLGAGFAGWDGDIALPDGQALPWVIVIACAGLTAHLCLTKALTLVPAVIVVPLDFARLPVIAIVGMLLYGERLDVFVFAGALVIFAANYLNIVAEARKASQN